MRDSPESSLPTLSTLTQDLLIKGGFPGIHLDEFYAGENFVHGADTVIGHHHGFPSEDVDQSGHEKLQPNTQVSSLPPKADNQLY